MFKYPSNAITKLFVHIIYFVWNHLKFLLAKELGYKCVIFIFSIFSLFSSFCSIFVYFSLTLIQLPSKLTTIVNGIPFISACFSTSSLKFHFNLCTVNAQLFFFSLFFLPLFSNFILHFNENCAACVTNSFPIPLYHLDCTVL